MESDSSLFELVFQIGYCLFTGLKLGLLEVDSLDGLKVHLP